MTAPRPVPAPLLHGRPTQDGRRLDVEGLAAEFVVLDEATALARLDQLRGPFALALPLRDGAWLLAVDRFGIESLCWRLVNGELTFDTRADQLADRAPAAGLDLQALFDYLHFHAIPSPRTVFEGVQRLPAAHALVWRSGAPSVRRYWTPRFDEPRNGDFNALKDEFRGLLRQAVQRRLDGSKPACYLSGGTDSSTVAGLVGEVAGEPALGYSIGFEAEGYDEMAYARIAAQRFGVQHREYYVTPADLVASMPAVAAHYDQPFGNSSAVPAFHCAQRAREDGVTHILAGDGGDELFGGNARYAKQRIFGWYGAVPGPLRRGLLEPLLLGTPLGRLPLARKGASYVEQARVPMPQRLEMYNLLHRVGPENVITPGLLAHIDRSALLDQQRQSWLEADAADPLNRTLAFEWRYTLAENDLPKVVGSAALAGLSVGFPMLDEDLLAFSMRLPVEFKLKGLKLRWFFKEALRGFLPDEIITKPKHGFGLPFGPWTVRDAGLRALADDALRSLADRGIVRSDFVRPLMDRLLPEHPGYYGELVWILTMLELWLRQRRPGTSLR